ncbi:MAG: SCP2 sterol-binding domain-containing protein, partial [Kofleriaceae bacterium]
ITSSMQPILDNLGTAKGQGGNEFIDVDEALGYQFPPAHSRYDERDLAIYALGVGAAADPLNDKDLQLVYELHGKGFYALPSFMAAQSVAAVVRLAAEGKQAPGLHYGLDRVLHGEQYTELKRPLPTKGKLTTKATVKNIYDKGKGALVITEFVSYDEHGDELVKNELTTFVRGAGGWGGERGPSADVNVPPDRAPDKTVEDKTTENQALIYRLSGDWNPLHADPSFAKAFGFQRPILHGLASFGFATRHVAQAFAPDGNTDYVKSIKARFASTVLPGQTLVTEMWKESHPKGTGSPDSSLADTRVVFRTKLKETGEVVISNAAVELWKEIPKPKDRSKPVAARSAGGAAAVPTSGDIFRAIGTFVGGNPATAEKAKTAFVFKLSSPDSAWTIDLTTPPGKVTEGAGTGSCTLEMSDADFMAMATGQADAMKLFSTGKLKISGDVMASQKLGFLKKLTPEMVLVETQKRSGGGGGAAAPAGVPADYVPTTEDVFAVIEEFLKQNPDVAAKVNTTYLWKIGPHTWTLDLKGAGSVKPGGDAGECTLELSEEDFLAMTQGKADPMKLFTTGKLKISGNIMASQKLNFLSKMDPSKAVEVIAKRKGAGASAAPAASAPGAAAQASQASQASVIFTQLAKRLADNPGLQNEVRATVKFVVDGLEQTFAIGGNDPKRVDATLTISDADLVALVGGKATAKNLYQHGKLKVDGDVSVAHRLGFLNKLV